MFLFAKEIDHKSTGYAYSGCIFFKYKNKETRNEILNKFLKLKKI